MGAGDPSVIATINRWAARQPGRMLAVLGVMLVVFAVVGGGVEERLSVGGFLDPDAESSQVADALEEDFGTGSYGFAVLLEPKDKWVYTDLNVPEGERITEAIKEEPGVLEVASFYNIPDPAPAMHPLRDFQGNMAVIAVKLAGTEDEQRDSAEQLHETYVRPNEFFDITATGSVEISRMAAVEAEGDLQTAELLAAPFTLIALLIVFRGLRAAILPLVVAVFAVLGSFMALTIVVQFTEISVFARTLVTVLGLGLAIDYSLLMVARFREERGAGRAVELAVSRTLQTAGRTVMFSAATVGSSLVGLLVFPVVYLRSFAFAGVAVVTSAAAAALLVVPPLLIKFGAKMGSAPPTPDSFWGRQAGRVMKRPLVWLLVVGTFLVFLGLPFARFEAGRTDERVLPESLDARIAAETIQEHMSWPMLNPIQVHAPGLDSNDDERILDFTNQMLEVEGVMRVDSKVGFFRKESSTAPNWLSGHFASQDGEASAGTWFNLVSWWDFDDPRVEGLVEELRTTDTSFGELSVGGNNAIVIDTVDAVTARVPAALAVIATVTLVLLFFMTGSVLIPIKAVLLNLLSLTAMLGALVWVFQEGNFADRLGITPTGEIDVFTPILMFCIAFGLSMDYEVFLLARIKEEYDLSDDNEQAIRVGIGRTGPVVTAAAVLLAIVFVAIATSGVVIVKMIGLGLGLAVISDAFLVRATLTPALMKVAGRANWWAPGPLRRFHLRWGIWETDPVVVPGSDQIEPVASIPVGGS